ncbi:type VI secretion system protein ImpA [Duganella sp. 1224]|uniref:type VI secretion system protein TssA n=1 Tax=Duganella sp. 1224 TaxID=2587052 RepID=UPI0015C71FF4|nr:type VI secretion system protein TssA [Duganella sp. 1224]NYE60072.1 type VI secretion system protein ImpA [Duganella sp. 1224]
MSAITPFDVASLSAALNEAAPCGDNLEYDPQFLAAEEAARGTPEVQYGSTITPATPPDWQAVRAQALALMTHSRDLRLAMLLARAQLALDGVAGLASALALLSALIERHWDHVHPQLDADDDHDPTLRINVLAALCDGAGLLRDLRETPLARVRAVGSVTLRDIDLAGADGAADDDGQQRNAQAMLEAVFSAADQRELADTAGALRACAASTAEIEQRLTQLAGVGHALDLSPLSSLLRRAEGIVTAHVQALAIPGEGGAGGATAAGHAGGAAAAGAGAGATARADQVSNRADVTRMLDKLCAYYAAHEPSSPVPLLLQRAARLVDMNFTELLQDLAPEGLGQLSQISGVRHEG